ncbi:MAG: M23 family metallopeptidase [Hyphomicrobiales bacterium]
MKQIILTSFFLWGFLSLYSQEKGFYPPIKEEIQLSGSFAELRKTHFHGGADIRTNAEVGRKIYAAADGYISKISISLGGYGKCIYITHPNGYTTIYGHLMEFNPKIERYVKKHQYKEESYTTELYPRKRKFRLKAGDFIALSGNTGHSGGPHLHFEIRDNKQTTQYNPVLFGYTYEDTIPPVFEEIAVYNHNQQQKAEHFDIKGCKETYNLEQSDTISVPQHLSFGICAYDQPNKNPNHNGIYSYELLLDGQKFWSFTVDSIAIKDTLMYYNVYDFPYQELTGRTLLKTYQGVNGKASMALPSDNSGLLQFNDTNYHTVKMILTDHLHNSSSLSFVIKPEKDTTISGNLKPLPMTDTFHIERKFAEIYFPANSFYDTSYMNIEKIDTNDMFPLININAGNYPTKYPFTVRLTIPKDLSQDLRSNLYVIRKAPREKEYVFNGKVEGNQFVFQTQFFGYYTLALDTTPPHVYNHKLDSLGNIEINIRDEESGIKKYRCQLNGKWILMEYEPKENVLIYKKDKRYKKHRRNLLQIEVWDNVGHKTYYETSI